MRLSVGSGLTPLADGFCFSFCGVHGIRLSGVGFCTYTQHCAQLGIDKKIIQYAVIEYSPPSASAGQRVVGCTSLQPGDSWHFAREGSCLCPYRSHRRDPPACPGGAFGWVLLGA